MSAETPLLRRKRLHMRSIRRGIKEMDVILSRYCEARLAVLEGGALDRYEALLDENDHDLYRWISGQEDAPEALRPAILDIRAHATGA